MLVIETRSGLTVKSSPKIQDETPARLDNEIRSEVIRAVGISDPLGKGKPASEVAPSSCFSHRYSVNSRELALAGSGSAPAGSSLRLTPTLEPTEALG